MNTNPQESFATAAPPAAPVLPGLPSGLTFNPPLDSEGGAARSYHQSSADLARGLEIHACPLGSLSPELIDEFLHWRAQLLLARARQAVAT